MYWLEKLPVSWQGDSLNQLETLLSNWIIQGFHQKMFFWDSKIDLCSLGSTIVKTFSLRLSGGTSVIIVYILISNYRWRLNQLDCSNAKKIGRKLGSKWFSLYHICKITKGITSQISMKSAVNRELKRSRWYTINDTQAKLQNKLR